MLSIIILSEYINYDQQGYRFSLGTALLFIYLFILEDSVLDDLREIETFGVSREQMNLMSVKVKQKTAGNEIKRKREI